MYKMILRIFVWFFFLVISLIYCVTSQKVENFVEDDEIERREPFSQLNSQKCQLYNQKDQQPLLSKLVNRIQMGLNLPETNRNFQYLIDHQSRGKKDCNSCNWEPWIPISAPVTEKNDVNVVSPMKFFRRMPNYYSDLNILPTLRPPPVLYMPHINKGNTVIVDYMIPPPVSYKSPSSLYASSKHVDHMLLNKPHYETPHTKYDFIQKKPFYNLQLSHLGHNNKHWKQLEPQNFITVDTSTSDRAVDSYGAPVTGDSLNYFPRSEQLSLANEHKEYLEKSIPLPNLSSFPILPFRDYEDFQNGFISNRYHNYNNINKGIKIEKSVKIADYLATIEHPVTVIRSPLIDLSITHDNFDKSEEHDEKKYGEVFTPFLYKNNENNKNNFLHHQESQTSTERTIYTKVEETPIFSRDISENSQNFNSYTNLSKFPIVVEDVHPAASSNNDTYVNYNEVIISRSKDGELDRSNVSNSIKVLFNNRINISTGTNLKELLLNRENAKTASNDRENRSYKNDVNFTTPALDYSNWIPSYAVTTSSNRASLNLNVPFSYTTTTKPNILQIIVPYINNKNTRYLENEWLNKSQTYLPHVTDYKGVYTTISSEITPPEIERISVWSNFNELTEIPKTVTPLRIISQSERSTGDIPYGIISLQKNIDNWTQQTFSENMQTSTHKENHSAYSAKNSGQLSYKSNEFNRSKAKKNENNDLISNLIIPTETLQKVITTTIKSHTNRSSERPQTLLGTSNPTSTVSPQYKQKYYVVTPQTHSYHTSTPATAWSSAPRIKNGQANNSSTFELYKFSIRVEPQNRSAPEAIKSSSKGPVKIVYSEWPHLVNNLQTTTNKPFVKHPLLGFMDIPEYAINSNSTIKTIFGSSLVTRPSSTSLLEKGTTDNTEFNNVYS